MMVLTHMLAIFLDMETTGLDPTKHCAIDVAFQIIDIGSGELKAAYQSVIKQPVTEWEKRDPVSIQINGYTWEELGAGKEPKVIGAEIIDLFQKIGIQRGQAVFICQNPAFDRGFFGQLIEVYVQERLNWPYHWLDLASMYWALTMQKLEQKGLHLPEKMNLSKNEIAKEYQLPAEVEPHRAMNGVEHLVKCYQAVTGAKFVQSYRG